MTILVQIAIGIAALFLLAFVVLCIGVRADDNGPGLHGRAPGPAAWLARRLTGLKTEPMPARAPIRRTRPTCAAPAGAALAVGPRARAEEQVAGDA